MARLVDLSPYHFARAFKQSFGVPPHRYHIERRIARAKELLSGNSVTEVAMAVGFAETSSFSTVFRRATALREANFVAEDLSPKSWPDWQHNVRSGPQAIGLN